MHGALSSQPQHSQGSAYDVRSPGATLGGKNVYLRVCAPSVTDATFGAPNPKPRMSLHVQQHCAYHSHHACHDNDRAIDAKHWQHCGSEREQEETNDAHQHVSRRSIVVILVRSNLHMNDRALEPRHARAARRQYVPVCFVLFPRAARRRPSRSVNHTASPRRYCRRHQTLVQARCQVQTASPPLCPSRSPRC